MIYLYTLPNLPFHHKDSISHTDKKYYDRVKSLSL